MITRKKIFGFILLTILATGCYIWIDNNPLPSPLLEQVRPIPNSPYISALGIHLYLDGEKYQFTGVNAFHLGTYPSVNAGCGSPVEDIDSFFSQFQPHTVVRIWAFQGGMATNVKTKKLDWRGLDRVVNAAQSHGMKLVLTLGDQSGTCDDGHWKDLRWYQLGYQRSVNDLGNGLTPLPYLDYVKAIVERYKDSTAIAMWEPINEPEASDCQNYRGGDCYNHQTCNEASASAALRAFYDTVGQTIKQIDNNHLISSGLIGSGQCGASHENYSHLHQSKWIDIASYHDYGEDTNPFPGDQWNGLKKRLEQMKQINKPLFIGEAGIKAKDNSSDCMDYAARKEKIKMKMDAQFEAGVVGYLLWAFTGGTSPICNYDIVDNDPLLSLLKSYPISMGNFSPESTSSGIFYSFDPQSTASGSQ